MSTPSRTTGTSTPAQSRRAGAARRAPVAARPETVRLDTLEPRVLLSAADPQAAQVMEMFSLSPALFVENQGQWEDESVRFLHSGCGVNAAVGEAPANATQHESVNVTGHSPPRSIKSSAIPQAFAESAKVVLPVLEQVLPPLFEQPNAPAQLSKLVASDGAQGHLFGNSLAIHDTHAIIGSPFPNTPDGAGIGSAYVFDVTNSHELRRLAPEQGEKFDSFGCDVDISSNLLAVGAYGEDDPGSNSGCVYIYDRASGQTLHRLTAADAAADDRFGYRLALSDDSLIVGAHGNDDHGSSSGSAYVFNAASGQQLRKLTASDGFAFDVFGYSVAVSGDTAVVGAYQDDDMGPESGSVYVFSASTGEQLLKLVATDGNNQDNFGYDVAVHGQFAVVGAPQADGGGAAYLFNINTGQQLHKLSPPDATESFGISVAIHAGTAIVGAQRDSTRGLYAGAAYVFDIATGHYIAKLVADDGASKDYFGRTVAMDGSNAIVGAPLDDDRGSSSGSVYVFDVARNAAPTIIDTTPLAPGDIAVAGRPYTIGWTAEDPDGDDMTISLFYDTDNQPGGEVPIEEAQNILQNFTGQNTFNWTVPEVLRGQSVYIRAVVTDGPNSDEDYSEAAVRVDDHGDSSEIATPIGLGEAEHGRLYWWDDEDWFSFDATPGPYSFITVSNGDPVEHGRLTVVDSSGMSVLGSRDGHYLSWDCQSAGTYFVVVDNTASEGWGYELVADRIECRLEGSYGGADVYSVPAELTDLRFGGAILAAVTDPLQGKMLATLLGITATGGPLVAAIGGAMAALAFFGELAQQGDGMVVLPVGPGGRYSGTHEMLATVSGSAGNAKYSAMVAYDTVFRRGVPGSVEDDLTLVSEDILTTYDGPVTLLTAQETAQAFAATMPDRLPVRSLVVVPHESLFFSVNNLPRPSGISVQLEAETRMDGRRVGDERGLHIARTDRDDVEQIICDAEGLLGLQTNGEVQVVEDGTGNHAVQLSSGASVFDRIPIPTSAAGLELRVRFVTPAEGTRLVLRVNGVELWSLLGGIDPVEWVTVGPLNLWSWAGQEVDLAISLEALAGPLATSAEYSGVAEDADVVAWVDDLVLTTNRAEVAARHVFYNRSAWDGNKAAADASDDAAIASDKAALLPGQKATFANYTNYSRGINGVMIDVANLADAAALTAADFVFDVGNGATWSPAAAPTSVTVRAGAGTGGSDRVTIIWPDNAIQKQWLRVRVLANEHTGLVSDDVHYWGHALGDTGNATTNTVVNTSDMLLIRNNPRTLSNPALLTNPYDINRDKQVNTSDMLLVRNHPTTLATDLDLFTAPLEGPGGQALALGATSGVSSLTAAAPTGTGSVATRSRAGALENLRHRLRRQQRRLSQAADPERRAAIRQRLRITLKRVALSQKCPATT